MTDICPICGGEFNREIWLVNPPIRGMKCSKCGRVEEVFRENSKQYSQANHRKRRYPY